MNSAELGFIPGCYKNFPCMPGESLPGYMLRLAEANAYSGIRELLSAAEIDVSHGTLSKLVAEIKASATNLGKVGAMAIGDRRHLLTHLVKPIMKEAIFVNSCRVDNDAFLSEVSQVCPHCLEDDGFSREEWELATVTTCSRHKVRLNDSCHACKAKIEWARPFLHHCGRCGVDFRQSPVTLVGDKVCEVSDDFSALAPFRFTLHGGERQIHLWDTAFRLFKSLSLNGGHWALAEWPGRFVQSLSIERRHAVVEVLARVRYNGSYALLELNEFVSQLLRALSVIPKPGLVSRQAVRMLQSAAGLPWEIATALSSPTPLYQDQLRGSAIFNGRPPSIVSLTGIAVFLAVDHVTVAGLLSNGEISKPMFDFPGFDIDQILAAQKFLTDGLLSLIDLHDIVGVPLDWHDPFFNELFPTWNKRNHADSRVTVDHVVGLQSKLIARWYGSPRPSKPVGLGQLARTGKNPFQSVAKGVTAILTSGIQRVDWGPPFDWASLVIDERDEIVVLNRAG